MPCCNRFADDAQVSHLIEFLKLRMGAGSSLMIRPDGTMRLDVPPSWSKEFVDMSQLSQYMYLSHSTLT